MFCRRCKTVRTERVEVTDSETGERKMVDVTVVNQGRMYVDRVFSDNMNYEVACILCGVRRYIGKSSVFGQWLHVKEEILRNAASGKSL